MNNIIKKISAFAMAFTLIGTGNATAKFFAPQANNTIVASAANNKLRSAVVWAITTANDNSHGYSQKNRNGNPDYDCSSFVIAAMKQAGINVGNATYTGNMRSEFTKHDFIWIDWKDAKSSLQYGDVLFKKGHTELYIGDNKRVGAHTDTDGKAGDSKGDEICIKSLGSSESWSGVLRLDATQVFDDVSANDWYADAVRYVYDNNFMQGMSDTTFGSAQNLTRGQFVTVLYNMAGQPRAAYNSKKFSDVKKDDYFAIPVMWAADNGIVSGTDNNKFSPNDNITREQVAVMLYNYAKYLNYDTSFNSVNLKQFFTDADKVDSWAADAVKWAVYKGIISGKATNSGTKLDPRGNATRAECAQIVKNFKNKVAK